MQVAKGTFSVEMKAQDGPVAVEGVSLARSCLEKRFEGDLGGSAGRPAAAPVRTGPPQQAPARSGT